jgi:hypothetical protein
VNINAAFPSKYLKAADLNGGSPVVTIDHVAIELVGGKDKLPICYFVGKQKGMVLNKTNATAIARMTNSPDTDEWHGTRVQLFVAQVEYQGELMDALRVRQPKAQMPAKPPKPIEPEPDPEPDFGTVDEDSIPF